jgi:catechol 2,3-dioxygenase-like lactoylglutathione lyase family enzyme
MVSSPALLGLSHVAVRAADVAASCAFYRDVLGFEEHCRLDDLRTGKLMLVCFKISDAQWLEVFDGPLGPGNVIHQVAFRVADAEAIRLRLAQEGANVPPTTPTGQMGNRNFVVPDPNGQDIEFVEHVPTSIIERDRGRFLGPSRISSRLYAVRVRLTRVAESEKFYGALGLMMGAHAVRTVTLLNGDRLEFLPRADYTPQFGLAVEDLAVARACLADRTALPIEEMKATDHHGEALQLTAPEGTVIRLTRLAGRS